MGSFGVVVMLVCITSIYVLIQLSHEVKNTVLSRRPFKEKKSKILSNSISSIKSIKLNCWEHLVQDSLEELRNNEEKILQSNFTLRGVNKAIISVIPSLTCLFGIAYFKVYEAVQIRVEVVYVILLYLDFLRRQMKEAIRAAGKISDALVSAERIRTFLRVSDYDCYDNRDEEDQEINQTEESEDQDGDHDSEDSKSNRMTGENQKENSESVINFFECSTSWENNYYKEQIKNLRKQKSVKEINDLKLDEVQELEVLIEEEVPEETATLKEIQLSIKKGQFVALIGESGSGKSTVLRTLLGEVNLVEGDYEVKGSVSYIPDRPFLINDTLRDNILFGKTYDRIKYELILDLCQIDQELETLPLGDETEIGQAGFVLSELQKQKVSIARGLYSESDIYIVDDCLGAFDSNIRKKILDEVFFDFLQGKTILMATNDFSILEKVDQIFALSNGRVFLEGTYEEIKYNSEVKILKENSQENEKKRKRKSQQSKGKRSKQTDIEKLRYKVAHPNTPEQSPTNSRLSIDVEIDKQEEDLPKTKKRGANHSEAAKFYLKNGKQIFILLSLLFFTLSTFLSVFSDWWAGAWISDHLGQYDSDSFYLIGYFVLILGGVSIYIIKFYLIGRLNNNASFGIFKKMVWNLLRRKTGFFDITASGEILGRCLDDVEALDYGCALDLQDFSEVFFTFLGALAVSIFGSLLIIPFIFAVFLSCWRLFLRYITVNKDLKKLSGVTRTSLMNLSSEVFEGSTTIRAYKYEPMFMEKWEKAHNDQISVYLLEKMAKYSFLFQVYLMNLVLLPVIFLIFFVKKVSGIRFIGGSNTMCMALTNVIASNMLVYLVSIKLIKLANNAPVIHKLKDYCSLSVVEADLDYPGLDMEWPVQGRIEINNLSLRYARGLPDVINGLDLIIRGGQKVGIVGLPGSGKTTLFWGLTRILEVFKEGGWPLGNIIIDGIDIAEIGLHVLRNKITVIPEDPFLLEGTLSYNLDPMELCSKKELINILEQVELVDAIKSLQNQNQEIGENLIKDRILDFKIEQKGANLTLGQRLLVCLARALASRPKILLMDEAESSVDKKTKMVIQRVIKNQMAGVTVLRITNRPEAVIGLDRVVVLSEGKKVEEGAPKQLMTQKGHFYRIFSEPADESKGGEVGGDEGAFEESFSK